MSSIFLYFLCLIASSYAIFAGQYVASLIGLDNRENYSRKYTEWHLGMMRINREGTAIYGFINLKKPLREPMIFWDTYVKKDQKWIKFAMDSALSKLSLCREDFKTKYYDKYFEGNGSWTFPDCVMWPGNMTISEKKALPFDEFVHELADEFPYGQFKVATTIRDKDNVQFGGMTFMADIKAKKKTKAQTVPEKQIKNQIPNIGAAGL